MKASLLFILLCIFNGFLAQNWQQLDDFPSASRDDAVVFTIGNNNQQYKPLRFVKL